MNESIDLTAYIEKKVQRTLLRFSLLIALLFFALTLFINVREGLKDKMEEAIFVGKVLETVFEDVKRSLEIAAYNLDVFHDEEKIIKLLERLYETLYPFTTYPIFTRSDGKFFVFPEYEYGPEYDPRKRPWYQEAIERPGETLITEPFEHHILKETTIAFVRSVLDENGEILGVLGLDFVSTHLKEYLMENSYLLSQNGVLISKKGNVSGEIDLERVDTERTVMFVKGSNWKIITPVLKGKFFLVAEIPIIWYVVSSLVRGSVIFALILVTLWLGNKTAHKHLVLDVIQPTRTIIDSVRSYEEGGSFSLDISTDVQEIKELSERISKMVATISNQMKELEMTYKEENQLRCTLEALLEISEEFMKGRKTEELFKLTLKKAVEVIPGAQAGSVLIRRGDRFYYVAAEGYDLEKLSDVSFSEEEIREWTKGECCSIRKIAALIDRELLDQDRYRKLVEHARFEEIRSNLCFVIDFKGKPMVLFNLDNFESEDAFNEVSLELVRLFATYTKILFERLKVEEELAEKTRLLEVFSYYDPLTGLPNRRLMEELSKKLLALAKREGKEIAVVFLDLSGFKKINDTFGHEAGDQILKEVSTRLKRVLRENDVIARFGGDEFVFIIYDCGKDCIETVLRRILNSLEKPLDIEGQKVQISGNFGVAFYPKDGEEFNNLLRKADFAMYLAKRNKEHVRFYEE